MLSPLGGSLLIPRLSGDENGGSRTLEAHSGASEGASYGCERAGDAEMAPAQRDMYCASMPCLGEEIARLHRESLRVASTCTALIDRYLMVCSLLEKGGPLREGSHSRSHLNITCLCGRADHTVVIDRAPTRHRSCFPFDVSHLSSAARPVVLRVAGRPVSFSPLHRGPHVPVEDLVPSMQDALQYVALPDLGVYVRALLIRGYRPLHACKHTEAMKRCLQGPSDPLCVPVFEDNAVDGLLGFLLQDGLPCLKKAKRSQKVVEFRHPPTPVEVSACVNVLHGTLLALYPLGAKRPTFSTRVAIARRMHALMTSGVTAQIEFLKAYPQLVKLCFMEYCINVLVDFLPCERKLLCSHQCMRVFQTVCPTTCDAFRTDHLESGLEHWDVLDRHAGVCIDRCLRMCKFKMFKTQDRVSKVLVSAAAFLPECLDAKCAFGHRQLLQITAPSMLGDDSLHCAEAIQRHLTVRALPLQVLYMQREAVGRLYGSCSSRVYAACNVRLCIFCALSGKGVRTPMRICVETRALRCTTCPNGSIVTINMLGVMLRICNSSYSLCPHCASMRIWEGDGRDFLPDGGQCDCQKPTVGERRARKNERASLQKRRDKGCTLCGYRNLASPPIFVPDIRGRCMRTVRLCRRHRPADHVLRTVLDLKSLQEAVVDIRRQ